VCCGRGGVNIVSKRQSRQYEMVAPGVKRYPDGREVLSPAALKARKDAMLRTNPHCVFCGQQFSDYREVDLCHVESKGMNGWRRNDSMRNLDVGHRLSNMECGSRNLYDYIDSVRKAGKKFPCEASC
jgi:hypothetical protein